MQRISLMLLLLLSLWLTSCNLSRKADSATLTSATFTPAPDATSTFAPAPNVWQPIAQGIEQRFMRVSSPFTDSAFDMPVLRIDPTQVQFKAHYEPSYYYRLNEWRARLDDPLLIVNANFFTAEGYAVGLVVSDGQSFGQSLPGYGGMLQVGAEGLRLRSLVTEPYNQAQAIEQAVQGFPMLIQPGGQLARTGNGFDTPARRTIIAQDRAGRILIMLTAGPLDRFTLRNAQLWLQASDLEIDSAFGLDGGKSSGMFIKANGGDIVYPTIDPIAVVLAVYPR